jgi:hypothetical protein
VIPHLVGDLDHAHEAGVESQDVDLALERAPDLTEHPLQLDVVEEVLRLIVERDGARGHHAGHGGPEERAPRPPGRGAHGVHPDGTGRIGHQRPRDHLALSHDRRGRAAEVVALVEVGVVPARAVVPDHQQVVLGRVAGDRPGDEVAQHRRIAGVGLAERGDHVGGQRSVLSQQVAIGRAAGAGAIELGDHGDLVAGADRLHLEQIVRAGAVEIVVAGEVHHDRPPLRLLRRARHRRLLGSQSSASTIAADLAIAQGFSALTVIERGLRVSVG